MSHNAACKFLALAISLTATTALAGNGAWVGPVTEVQYINGSASWMPQLYVKVNDSVNGVKAAIAQQPSPGECSLPTTSLDTMKVWQAMLTAAMLSGKSVTVYWNDCSGGTNKYIYSVVLIP